METFLYARTKEILGTINEYLATANGDMRERLKIMSVEIVQLSESDFPEILKKDWNFVEKTLTKYPETFNHRNEQVLGSMENTLNHIQNRTACKVARKLYSLYAVFYFGEYSNI
ncbi:MAG: hypothetical protein DRQ78_13340 [Epsilonproteobacteria bacterium]|nr:MAG: hypothetical protein DRQ78_13340 [Campylobacterota bacterium]